jgi:tripartite motif-containing protein 71
LRPSAVCDMDKRVCFLVASLCLAASYAALAAGEAVVRYEYAGGWDRYGPAPAEGEEAPTFHRLCGVAVGPDGTVYVTDDLHFSIFKFTPAGSFLGQWGPYGPVRRSVIRLGAIAVTADGPVYVADHFNLRLAVDDGERFYLADCPAPYGRRRGGMYSPVVEDVAVGADGNVYVCYRSSGPLKIGSGPLVRIERFTPAGSLVAHWVASGGGMGVGPDGKVYVADHRKNFVDVYDARGRYRGLWGGEGSGPGKFRRPTDVAVGPDGTVFVADAGNYRVQYFTSSGRYLGQWGEAGTKAGQFLRINALAVGPDGTVYVVDQGNGRIQYFKPVVTRTVE